MLTNPSTWTTWTNAASAPSIEDLRRTAEEFKRLPKPLSAIIATPAGERALRRRCPVVEAPTALTPLGGWGWGRPLGAIELHVLPTLSECLGLAREVVDKGRRVAIIDDDRCYMPDQVEAMLRDAPC